MLAQQEENVYAKYRILVLEDEEHIRKIICRLLRQIGFQQIHEAANGDEGFKQVLRTKPKVILCDIHMQPMGGLTFLKNLRNLSRSDFADIPVIFLTADTQRETVSEALNLRVDGYLAKPVSLSQLKSRLDAVLSVDD